jgi:hypothetical protein
VTRGLSAGRASRLRPNWSQFPLSGVLLCAAIASMAVVLWSLPTHRVLAFLGEEPGAAGDLSGVVIRPDDIPRDERGRPHPELVLDLPAPEPMKPEIKARIDQLRERYRREAASVPRGFFATRTAPPPAEANAPPRMDSGDPNPDRVVMHEAPEGR